MALLRASALGGRKGRKNFLGFGEPEQDEATGAVTPVGDKVRVPSPPCRRAEMS